MDYSSLEASARSIRSLAMDAVEKANSGHPGLPMGCAEIASALFGEILNHDPLNPQWPDRDRFVLSAGHGSALLYSVLHLNGYDVSIDDLKSFRQLGSRTPGHPEYGELPGVETTTGPLGNGLANAVGLAIAETILAEHFNTSDHEIIDHHTYALAGDGCLMEGISYEAASLAGHLKLGKLIVLYDSNKISIEGSTSLAFTEDVPKRFEAAGWQTLEGDGHNFNDILYLLEEAKAEKHKPTLIKLKTVIGKGAPTKEGSEITHGSPLGKEEIRAAKQRLGLPEDQTFYVDPKAYEYYQNRLKDHENTRKEWETLFSSWRKANPDLAMEWDSWHKNHLELPQSYTAPTYKIGDKIATRAAGGRTLNALSGAIPQIVGGSADLSPSTKTLINGGGSYSAENRCGRNLHYGVREHVMGAIENGLMLHGGLKAYCSTFLVFSDYMRPPIRLAALMNLPSIFVFTHDSVWVGEDGPTHQPIEQIETLRAIPNLNVFRPADGEETNLAWELAVTSRHTPSALLFSRQNLPVFEKPERWRDQAAMGAYIAKDTESKPEIIIIATGSEVSIALEAADKSKKRVRVVSMLCRDLFETQAREEQEKIITPGIRCITAEAGIPGSWTAYAEKNDIMGIDRFGASGPGEEVIDALGITAEKLIKML